MRDFINTFLLVHLLFGCASSDEANRSIELSIEEINLISKNMEFFDEMYSDLNREGVPLHKLGYAVTGNGEIFLKHCFDMDKMVYLPYKECNYQQFSSINFNESEVISKIYELRKIGVISLSYEASIYRHVVQFYRPYNQYQDKEYYCMRNDLTDSTINISYLELYDEKHGLILLGAKNN